MKPRVLFLWLIVFALVLVINCTSGNDGDDDDDDGGDDDDDDDDDGGDDDDASDDDDAGDDDDSGNVQDPQQSDCLTYKSGEPDYTFEESLVIDYANGDLLVQHLNTCRNCDFLFQGTYAVEGLVISMLEADVEPMVALCDCPYNLSYTIPGVEAAAYQFSLSIANLKQGMDPTPILIFEDTLDLNAQSHFEFDLGEHECI